MDLTRRTLMGSAALAVGALAAPPTFEMEEATVADLQKRMSAGSLTASALTQRYLERIAAIDKRGPALNSVIELNPDALSIAAALDAERIAKGPRGPLHGIPVLIKDNIDTADRMMTTAGSRPAPCCWVKPISANGPTSGPATRPAAGADAAVSPATLTRSTATPAAPVPDRAQPSPPTCARSGTG